MTAGNLRAALAAALQGPVGALLSGFDALVRVRRSVEVRDEGDNSVTQRWADIPDGASVGAVIELTRTDGTPETGAGAPVYAASITVAGPCAPRAGDGIVVLAGRYAGLTFRVTETGDALGVVTPCTCTGTPERFGL